MIAADLVLILALILVNGFFAMSELAIVSSRRARLQNRANMGSRGARVALELSDDPTRFLSTVQIGITLIGILAGAFSGATIAEHFATSLIENGVRQDIAELVSIGVVVIVLTFVSLVIGELVPKRFALTHPDAIASRVAPAIELVARVTHPVVALLRFSTEGILRVLGMRWEHRAGVTDEEINALLAEGAQQGLIDSSERQMVEEVLRLADRPVRTIMTHRRELIWLDVKDSEQDVRAKITDNGHSRFLVCEDTLDNCLGYVRTRAIVDRLLDQAPLDLRPMIREPLRVVPELKTLTLMAMFRRSRPHIAVIADEYGTILGVVTPVDVLETIAGDLPEDVAAGSSVTKREDGSWLVDADVELHDLEHRLGAGGLASGDFATLAGLILEELRRIPQTGEVVGVNGWRLEIVDMDGTRIDKVLVTRLAGRTARV
jgi:putative hemolysin